MDLFRGYYIYQSIVNITSDVINDKALLMLGCFLFQRMHEIFQKFGWANPAALSSEAGPTILQVPFSSKNENVQEKSKKKESRNNS